MKTSVNKPLKFRVGSEILDVKEFELHSMILSSSVDIYYISSKDGKYYVRTCLLEDLPHNVRVRIMGRK